MMVTSMINMSCILSERFEQSSTQAVYILGEKDGPSPELGTAEKWAICDTWKAADVCSVRSE